MIVSDDDEKEANALNDIEEESESEVGRSADVDRKGKTNHSTRAEESDGKFEALQTQRRAY